MIPGLRVHGDAAHGVHAAGGVKAVALAGVEVVRAVCRGGVDRAGALVGGDVSGQHAENAAIKKRMLECGALQHAALEAGQLLQVSTSAQVAGGSDCGGQFGGDDVDLIAGLQRNVLEVWMEGHGQRCGQRPRGGRPDDR